METAVQKTNKALRLPRIFGNEDWWSVWLGLGVVVLAVGLWGAGSTLLKALAVSFPGWSDLGKISASLRASAGYLAGLYLFFLVIFAVVFKSLGFRLKQFAVGFTMLFLLAVLITVFGSWSVAKKYNLEPPLLALLVGLVIGNLLPIPKWLDTALRTEFYVKTGIVLLGATLPFSLILQAGPVAFAQATVVALATFLTIYLVGTRWLKLDQRFAATLAAGGSICGVSASIAVGGSVKAEKQHVSIAISLVVVWAVIMVFVLPFVIKAAGIAAGPAGAWIGTSEFADAAGMAAAASIGEQAIKTFTLNKVIGRDMFIGIWSFILALIAVTKWEKRPAGARPSGKEIWLRFPKFVLGFFVASAIVTVLVLSVDAGTAKSITTYIVNPLKELRTWTFIFTFLSIGLTTRFRDLTSVGWRPLVAFTAGVAVNVPLGYFLSVVLLNGYWSLVR